MIDGWEYIKLSWHRLTEMWQGTEPEIKHAIILEELGLATMGGSIIYEFGWGGLAFCAGFICWWVNK
jgi:hypothetical protein